MTRLSVLLLVGLVGCSAHNTHNTLYVVDSGYVRQYLWDGGKECGWIQGDSGPYLTFRYSGVVESEAYYVRRQDAINWVEQVCKNAIHVPTKEPQP